MAICKPLMWEEYNNTDTLVPWYLTEDFIYLTKKTPQYDDLVLSIIYELSPHGYYDEKYPQGDNN